LLVAYVRYVFLLQSMGTVIADDVHKDDAGGGWSLYPLSVAIPRVRMLTVYVLNQIGGIQ